ncbi:MAG: hypothetical protein IPH66_03960 [Crocinitomicaceae bacterium]|nr:hypothetical protein [Crocinitomicaceae bacterium]
MGDETLAKAWVMNPYMQYFCGASNFQHIFPWIQATLYIFVNELVKPGWKNICSFNKSSRNKAKNQMLLSDTTVQENNTTFPTDAKLAKSY